MNAGQVLKLAILVPSADQVYMDFALSLVGLVRHCAITPAPDGRQIRTRVFNVRTSVLQLSRNWLFRMALEWGADWMLCLDSDMVFPQDAAHRLLGAGKDLVGCAYGNRTIKDAYPVARELVWKNFVNKEGSVRVSEPAESESSENHVVLAPKGVKFGCLLVASSAVNKLPSPLVNFEGNPDYDPRAASEKAPDFVHEDTAFCRALQRVGTLAFMHTALSNEIRHIGVVYFRKSEGLSARCDMPTDMHAV